MENYFPVRVDFHRYNIKIISNTDKNYRKDNQQIPFNHFGNTELNSYNKSEEVFENTFETEPAVNFRIF